MSKEHDKYMTVKITPDTLKKLRRYRSILPAKPSLAAAANYSIQAWSDHEDEQRKNRKKYLCGSGVSE